MTFASYYKHYWDNQLTDLKRKSSAAHDMWKIVGWPSQGPICETKRLVKAEYKLVTRSNGQQTISKFLMTCMIIFCQKIPMHSAKHGKTRSKVNTNCLCQWMALLNPVKLPMPLPSILKIHVHPIMKHNQELRNKFLARFSQYNPACDCIQHISGEQLTSAFTK